MFLLFYSPEGGSTIGGIWNPNAERQQAWHVGIGFPVKPVQTDPKELAGSKAKFVELDKKAVLSEIERTGKGLVVSAEEVASSN